MICICIWLGLTNIFLPLRWEEPEGRDLRDENHGFSKKSLPVWGFWTLFCWFGAEHPEQFGYRFEAAEWLSLNNLPVILPTCDCGMIVVVVEFQSVTSSRAETFQGHRMSKQLSHGHVNIQSLSIKKNRFLYRDHIMLNAYVHYTIMLCSCCWCWCYRWQLLKDANRISFKWKSLHMTMAMDISRLFNLNWFRTGKTVSIQNSSILEWPLLKTRIRLYCFLQHRWTNPARSLAPDHCAVSATHLLDRNLWSNGWHREGYKTEGHLKVDPKTSAD